MAADASVDFYFDPTCGWAWRTSIWMRRIAKARGLSVTWKPYSLAVVNSPDDYTKGNPGHVVGVPLLRTLVLARRTAGNDAVDRLYVAYGNIYHGDIARDNVLDDAVQERCLEAAGLPASLYAAAVADTSTENEIISDTKTAIDSRGVFGVPTLAFSDSDVAFFGPVINAMPGDQEGTALWDWVAVALKQPFLYEFKRNRTRASQYAPNQYAD